MKCIVDINNHLATHTNDTHFMHGWTPVSWQYGHDKVHLSYRHNLHLQTSPQHSSGDSLILGNTNRHTKRKTHKNKHTQLYEQSPVCTTICSNKRQWVFSKLYRLQSAKVTTEGFSGRPCSSLVTQMLHSERARLIGWSRLSGTWRSSLAKAEWKDGRGGGRVQGSIYKWSLKQHDQHHWRQVDTVCYCEMMSV